MATQPSDEELLDVGRRPWARWRRRAAVLAVGAAAAAGIVYLANRPDRTPTPLAVATRTPTQSQPPVITAADDVPSFVLGIATQPGPLVDYIRSNGPPGQCALVAVGASPQRSITAALRTAFPQYRVVDAARVLDQYTGLCILDVRARDATGSVLVLEVVSPGSGTPRAPTVIVAGRAEGADNVSTARVITPAGWQVTIGTVGPRPDRAPDQLLRDFAGSAALRW